MSHPTSCSDFPRCIAVIFLAMTLAGTVGAQTVYDIDTLTDAADLSDAGDGLCAVREAIANINSGADQSAGDCPLPGLSIDTLEFSVSGTIVLDGAALVTSSPVVFSGPGHDLLEISGNDLSAVIRVTGGATVLRKIAVTHGNSDHGALWLDGDALLFIDQSAIHDNQSTGAGGGIFVDHPDGNLILTNSAVYNNEAAGGGGGLFANSPVESVSNVTFSGNFAARGGGAIQVAGDSLTANNITVFNNTSDTLAGGIHAFGYIEIKNSIVLGNLDVSHNVPIDCSISPGGEYFNGEYNLVGDGTGCPTGTNDLVSTAPAYELDTILKVNGSGTPTHALVFGSQALDNGDTFNGGVPGSGCIRLNGGTIVIDQRFLPRASGAGMGGSGCDIGAFEAQDEIPGVEADIEMFLQGPYIGGASMDVGDNFEDNTPQFQTYRAGLFNGSELEYDGLESTNIPLAGMIDWVLVSLRSGSDAASEVARGVGILMEDGTLAGLTGGPIPFSGVTPGHFYVVVDHWSHLGIMSAETIDFTSGSGGINFKLADAAWTSGGTPLKLLEPATYGLFACDANFDGQITAPDFNIWNAATTAGATGYVLGDCNMDGQVTAPDFNLWNANTTAGAASQVPN